MKYLTKIPSEWRRDFAPLKVSNARKFVYEDLDTPQCRIVSPVTDPFQKQWVVLIHRNMAKTDNGNFPSRIDFKLFDPSEAEDITEIPKGVILRPEVYKSTFPFLRVPNPSFGKTLEHVFFFVGKTPNTWVNYLIFNAGAIQTSPSGS